MCRGPEITKGIGLEAVAWVASFSYRVEKYVHHPSGKHEDASHSGIRGPP